MSELEKNTKLLVQEVIEKFSEYLTQPWLLVDSKTQTLHVVDKGVLKTSYPVSTSKYGLGCEQDSFKTPIGAHKIAECIGDNLAINTIFKGRKSTGEIATIVNEEKSADLDLILTRILWLQGLEEQKNCGGNVDSYQRYIYIHGTHEEGLLGKPASHGCVRMANRNVIDLYDQISENTFVYIK